MPQPRDTVEGAEGETEPLVIREQEPVDSGIAAGPSNWNAAAGGDAGGKRGWWPFRPKARRQQMDKPRSSASVKVEPKVFFSNERTFIAWMHVSVTMATIATAIISFGDRNPWSELYGLILLPVAIAFVVYSLYQYMRRARLIRHRAPGPYEDNVGPTVLATMLMVAIILNVTIKLYELYA
eukprot:TRINITY_DN1895_c0_g1_i5.p1 TRINITY_DN1895_c0_g1~~TRINITY_DN1895_c0_g1_i5.p1  ORF type:complete len:181 (-),score=44.99 TRINITY_DN1895_c0_g1_i5:72-614(-)